MLCSKLKRVQVNELKTEGREFRKWYLLMVDKDAEDDCPHIRCEQGQIEHRSPTHLMDNIIQWLAANKSNVHWPTITEQTKEFKDFRTQNSLGYWQLQYLLLGNWPSGQMARASKTWMRTQQNRRMLISGENKDKIVSYRDRNYSETFTEYS